MYTHDMTGEREFQSTPPARGATGQWWEAAASGKISIHAPREGGDRRFAAGDFAASEISIHAPREGGDTLPGTVQQVCDISIHAPREGGDSKDAQFYLRIFDK